MYVSMSTSFQNDGVRMDFSYFLEEESIEWEGQSVQAQEVLPSDSLVAMSTMELLQGWEQWWDIIQETDPYTADDLRQLLRDFEAEVGIDVDEDVLDTLSGELAVALLPSDFDFSSEDGVLDSPVHALLLAGLEDPETLEDTLDTLLSSVEQDYDYSREDIGEFEAVTVSPDQVDESLGEYSPSFVVMDDWAALGSTLESLEELHDALTGASDSLDDNAEFRRVMDAAPAPVHYFMYLNVFALVEAIDGALDGDDRDTFRNDMQPYIKNLSAFLITTTVTAQEVRTSAILTVVE